MRVCVCVCVCKLPFFLPGATAHGCASAARSSAILRGPCPARVLQGSACGWLWPGSSSFKADCAGACMDFTCGLCSQAFLACLGVARPVLAASFLCSQEAAAAYAVCACMYLALRLCGRDFAAW